MSTNPLTGSECKHPDIPQPSFDEEAAKGLSTEEIRKRWPRVYTECKRCKAFIIHYASTAHFIYGDW